MSVDSHDHKPDELFGGPTHRLNQNNMEMELTAVFIAGAIVCSYLYHRLTEVEKEAEDLKKQVKSLQSGEKSSYDLVNTIWDMAVESRVRLYKLENPEPTPKHIAEDVLVALGGTVDRCFDKDGRLKSITIQAPWMKEPFVGIVGENVWDPIDGDFTSITNSCCLTALRQLTKRSTEKKPKK